MLHMASNVEKKKTIFYIYMREYMYYIYYSYL